MAACRNVILVSRVERAVHYKYGGRGFVNKRAALKNSTCAASLFASLPVPSWDFDVVLIFLIDVGHGLIYRVRRCLQILFGVSVADITVMVRV
jgi:hypothetical protein